MLVVDGRRSVEHSGHYLQTAGIALEMVEIVTEATAVKVERTAGRLLAQAGSISQPCLREPVPAYK